MEITMTEIKAQLQTDKLLKLKCGFSQQLILKVQTKQH